SEPVEIKSGEWEYFTIHTGAKSFSFLGLTESQHGNVEVAFTNHISGTSMPYSYEKIPISNNRFETDTYVSKSETVRFVVKNVSNQTITIQRLQAIENPIPIENNI